MIDTVIFDLGKVLVEYDWESYLKQFCFDEKTFQVLADAIFLSEAWILGDQGAVTPEEWLHLPRYSDWMSSERRPYTSPLSSRYNFPSQSE